MSKKILTIASSSFTIASSSYFTLKSRFRYSPYVLILTPAHACCAYQECVAITETMGKWGFRDYFSLLKFQTKVSAGQSLILVIRNSSLRCCSGKMISIYRCSCVKVTVLKCVEILTSGCSWRCHTFEQFSVAMKNLRMKSPVRVTICRITISSTQLLSLKINWTLQINQQDENNCITTGYYGKKLTMRCGKIDSVPFDRLGKWSSSELIVWEVLVKSASTGSHHTIIDSTTLTFKRTSRCFGLFSRQHCDQCRHMCVDDMWWLRVDTHLQTWRKTFEKWGTT